MSYISYIAAAIFIFVAILIAIYYKVINIINSSSVKRTQTDRNKALEDLIDKYNNERTEVSNASSESLLERARNELRNK